MKGKNNKLAVLILLMVYLGLGLFLSATNANAEDVGAWYGDNNLTNYYTANPNGDGGHVDWWRKKDGNWGWKELDSRDRNDATPSAGSNAKFQVVPDTGNGYQIKWIKYAIASNYDDDHHRYDTIGIWTDVPVSTPTAATEFIINPEIQEDKKYVIWVVFEKTGTSTSYTVTANVYQEADAASANYMCNSSIIYVTGQSPDPVTPQIAVKSGIAANGTAPFSFTPTAGCEIDSVKFASGSFVAYTTNSYVTPAITVDSLVEVKFRKVSLAIVSAYGASNPSGSGTINPLGSTPVAINGSQSYTITPQPNYRILNVVVTDTNAGYSSTDLGSIYSYTFNNVTANGSITVTFAADTTTTDSYCQIPPFISGQSNLTPNVLIVFDNSGSMAEKAYQVDSASYSFSTTYYGYFDNTKMYKLNSTTKTYTVDTSAGLDKTISCSSATTVACSGNRLNFDNMSKVDVVRKVLTGGKTVDRTATTKQLKLNNNYLINYGTDEPTGIVQSLAGKVRFGLMVINGSHTGELIAKLGDSSATVVTAIEGSKTDPNGYTPLAHTLYEAVRYFEAMPSAYGSVDYGTIDPIQYACQKHFALVLTDGVPNNNNNLPGAGSITDSDFNVTTWLGRITTADKADPDTDGEKTAAVAYYAHNRDLRSLTVGKNAILGKQNVSFYTVYTFGKASERTSAQGALKATSKYGAFQDTNSKSETDSTYNESVDYAKPDLDKEWDKNEPTDGIPDTFFSADQGDVLATNISTAMSDILAKVASGTAASILSNSEGSGANLLQAVFYPNKIFKNATQVNWIGEMQNLWYYVDPFLSNSTVREDSNYTSGDHLLELKTDKVVRFFFDGSETLAELKLDTNGDGAGETVTSSDTDPDDVKSIWRAGKTLWAKSGTTRTIHTSINGTSFYEPVTETSSFKGGFFTDSTDSTGGAAGLRSYLQAADLGEAKKLINYIRGTDQTGYRDRKVSILTTDTPSEWKLGDIVASTPRLQTSNKLNIYNLESPSGYEDKSYASFTNTANYKKRGMVYVGANDGMLHAFKLGNLTVTGSSITGYTKAILSGTNLGDEQWSYIPRNALPYLKYFADPDYKHLYYVDGPTVLVDLPIKKPATCTEPDYANCPKDATGGTNWKTVLIGSMGLGGASKLKGSSCANGSGGTCVKTPIYDPTDTATPDTTKTRGIGYSSYFALDVTDQYFDTTTGALASQPALKWEFSHPELGYATSGAAIVRISATTTTTTTFPDKSKNGKSYAVFASGPTGPIDEVAHQFIGKSDQNLKLFIVDLGATGALVEGTNYWVKDTGIQRAFAGNIVNAAIDTDKWNKNDSGNYQDDALYIGYTKANIDDGDPITATTAWSQGGVIRLLTNEDANPVNWTVSKVIEGIGPVTSGVAKLQDRKNMKLWLYFGTGRFFYSADDTENARHIMGVQDLCYNASGFLNKIKKNCTVSDAPVLGLSNLTNQTTTIGSLLDVSGNPTKGWYIVLDPKTSTFGAERAITDPVALSNGLVLYTTFKPTSDVCKFGGDSYVWGVKYNTGGIPLSSTTGGKMLVQVSTGAFEEISLSSALTAMDGRKMGTPMVGKPPSDPPPVVSNAGNKPAKKILHLQEK